MGIFNVKTISKYFATTVYISTIIKYFTHRATRSHQGADNALAVIFGPAWAIAVCGLLVNNFFYKDIAKRDKTTLIGRRLGDIFGHIIPAIIVTMYAPDRLPISKTTYISGILIIFLVLIPWLQKVYVGVPGWVIWGLAPSITIISTCLRY